MAIFVDKNGVPYLLTDCIIEEPEGVGQIFNNLKSLAATLNNISGISRTNLGAVQSTIHAANETFNVFAVASHLRNSESLIGVTSSNGRRNLTTEGFIYNTSNSNRLSTGKTIVNMSGGSNFNLAEIDGKKWMACAIYDGTSSFSPPNGFRGILLWIFTGQAITSTNSVVATGSVSNAASIFRPSNFGTTSTYRQIYQVVINKDGGISASNTSGNAGWLYSSSQLPGVNGYYTVNRFSDDDGLWAFVLGDKVNGNSPGPGFARSNGYGFGNYDRTDSGSYLYWAGVSINSTNYVGFIFTGDA